MLHTGLPMCVLVACPPVGMLDGCVSLPAQQSYHGTVLVGLPGAHGCGSALIEFQPARLGAAHRC
jgi:hypothetical protein